ncbi:MAG: hypothetical protein U0S48_06060 [Solirubrobacteraceae bacterium]
MACGAVPVVGDGPAGVEVSRSGRAAVVVSAAATSDLNCTQATVDLAADWPRFRRLRHHALSTSAQQGLIGGGTARLTTLLLLAQRLGCDTVAPPQIWTAPDIDRPASGR